MMRLIALVFAALALMSSPVLMTGAAVAASRTNHAVAMDMAGHCEGMMPAKSDGKGAMKMDCAAACSILQAIPPLLTQGPCLDGAEPARSVVAQLDGITMGHEPPPPRMAS